MNQVYTTRSFVGVFRLSFSVLPHTHVRGVLRETHGKVPRKPSGARACPAASVVLRGRSRPMYAPQNQGGPATYRRLVCVKQRQEHATATTTTTATTNKNSPSSFAQLITHHSVPPHVRYAPQAGAALDRPAPPLEERHVLDRHRLGGPSRPIRAGTRLRHAKLPQGLNGVDRQHACAGGAGEEERGGDEGGTGGGWRC